jgi:hypothetical protein
VLRKIPKGKLKGKMHGKWEGPFIATATSNEAAFKLHQLKSPTCGMWTCSRSTLFDAAAKWQPFVSSFCSLCFFYV